MPGNPFGAEQELSKGLSWGVLLPSFLTSFSRHRLGAGDLEFPNGGGSSVQTERGPIPVMAASQQFGQLLRALVSLSMKWS